MADQLVLARLFEIEARLGEKSALLEGVVVVLIRVPILFMPAAMLQFLPIL